MKRFFMLLVVAIFTVGIMSCTKVDETPKVDEKAVTTEVKK